MPQDDAILLKVPGLYCFLFRCKVPEAEPFMEWVVETILLRKARKLTSVIKERGAALALFTDDLQDRNNQIQVI